MISEHDKAPAREEVKVIDRNQLSIYLFYKGEMRIESYNKQDFLQVCFSVYLFAPTARIKDSDLNNNTIASNNNTEMG